MKLLSRVKGRLSINIGERPFTSGDFVNGDVLIRSRRPLLDGLLVLHLRCDETLQTWDGDRRQHFVKQELFCWAVLTEQDVTVQQEQRFPFAFQVPRSNDGHAVDSMPGWGSASGRIVTASNNWASTVAWSLEARLHIGGLDLHDTAPMNIFIR